MKQNSIKSGKAPKELLKEKEESSEEERCSSDPRVAAVQHGPLGASFLHAGFLFVYVYAQPCP